MLNLFTIEGDQLVFNKDEALYIDEFYQIYKRKKTMVGDQDGRRKKMAILELLFVKKMASLLFSDSIYIALPDERRIKTIAKDVGLPKSWKPDKQVMKAVNKYREMIKTLIPTAATLVALEQGMMVSSDALNVMTNNISEEIENLNRLKKIAKRSDLNEDKQAYISSLTETSKTLSKLIMDLMKIGKGVPETISNVEQLRVVVSKEVNNARKKKGGKDIGRRENPPS